MNALAAVVGMLPALQPVVEPALEMWEAADPGHAARWLAAWLESPERDVFAHPGYVGLYATAAARGLCAAWRGRDVTILYPFLLRDLSAEPFAPPASATDITTPPGYGGPVCWGAGDRAAAGMAFWAAFGKWATEHDVVTEFVRFNLFHDPLGYPGEYDPSRRNVAWDLGSEPESLWAGVRPKVRKNVNTARRLGVRVEVDPAGARLDDFLRIYEHTMVRHEAGAAYHYPRDYFERLGRALPERYCYFHALHDGRVVSTELVLTSERSVYSFLGGTLAEAFPLRPNDLLKYEIMLWARGQGKRWFVLGGGAKGEDGIFDYKRSFAPDGLVPFCLGKRVLRPDVCAALVENRKALAAAQGVAWEPTPGFFPAYRG